MIVFFVDWCIFIVKSNEMNGRLQLQAAVYRPLLVWSDYLLRMNDEVLENFNVSVLSFEIPSEEKIPLEEPWALKSTSLVNILMCGMHAE